MQNIATYRKRFGIMLVEFKLKNYRCFKDEQSLSLIPGAKSKHAFNTGTKSVPDLLPATGIFGANASGKSTITKGLEFLQGFVINSSSMEKDEPISVKPFILSKETRNAPCELEISFIHKKNLYRYGFSVDHTKVWEEWLYTIPHQGRTNEVFTRSYDTKKREYVWFINDKLIKGPKTNWRLLTKRNSLFISTVIQNIEENLLQKTNYVLDDVYNWFSKNLFVVQENERVSEQYSAKLFHEKSPESDDVIAFLNSLDMKVSSIRTKKLDIPEKFLSGMPSEMQEHIKSQPNLYVEFGHIDNDNEEQFWGITQESGGTEKLFCMSRPILEVLRDGNILIIDELHNNLHPHLMEKIIGLFQSKKTNTKNAQLIFTSHDVTAMNPAILEKDQIWLTDKGANSASKIIPLLEFKPRGESMFWKNYLAGKYGAVPNIKWE